MHVLLSYTTVLDSTYALFCIQRVHVAYYTSSNQTQIHGRVGLQEWGTHVHTHPYQPDIHFGERSLVLRALASTELATALAVGS